MSKDKKDFNDEQKKYLKKMWQEVEEIQVTYGDLINELEEKAKEVLGINIEIFHGNSCMCRDCEHYLGRDSAVGVGDAERKYNLLQLMDFEQENS